MTDVPFKCLQTDKPSLVKEMLSLFEYKEVSLEMGVMTRLVTLLACEAISGSHLFSRMGQAPENLSSHGSIATAMCQVPTSVCLVHQLSNSSLILCAVDSTSHLQHMCVHMCFPPEDCSFFIAHLDSHSGFIQSFVYELKLKPVQGKKRPRTKGSPA